MRSMRSVLQTITKVFPTITMRGQANRREDASSRHAQHAVGPSNDRQTIPHHHDAGPSEPPGRCIEPPCAACGRSFKRSPKYSPPSRCGAKRTAGKMHRAAMRSMRSVLQTITKVFLTITMGGQANRREDASSRHAQHAVPDRLSLSSKSSSAPYFALFELPQGKMQTAEAILRNMPSVPAGRPVLKRSHTTQTTGPLYRNFPCVFRS